MIIRKNVSVTDLSQQLKHKREFLKWMARRNKESNPEQSAAFTTGANLFEELRQDLLAGWFDVDPPKELFTDEIND